MVIHGLPNPSTTASTTGWWLPSLLSSWTDRHCFLLAFILLQLYFLLYWFRQSGRQPIRTNHKWFIISLQHPKETPRKSILEPYRHSFNCFENEVSAKRTTFDPCERSSSSRKRENARECMTKPVDMYVPSEGYGNLPPLLLHSL